MKLLENDIKQSKDRAKMCEFIKGPTSLSKHYSKLLKMTIYLFGEYHYNEYLSDED